MSKSISSITAGLLCIYSLFALTFDADFRGELRNSIRQPLLLPLGIYILFVLFSLIYSEDKAEGLHHVMQLSNLVLVYLIASTVIDMNRDDTGGISAGEFALLTFLAGIFVLDLIGLLTYFGAIANRKFSLPLRPLNMHHIWFGNLNAMGLYVCFALLAFSERFRRLPMIIAVSCCGLLDIFSVFLSLSRTAWAGVIGTSIICMYFSIRNKRAYLAFVLSIVVVCSVLYLSIDLVRLRIDAALRDVSVYSASAAPTSLGDRFFMWKAASEMFLSHPVLGVGIGGFKISLDALVASGKIPAFILKYNQPHNMFLFAAATQGLIGLSALLFLFYKVLRISLSLVKPAGEQRLYGYIGLAVAVHFLIGGMTESLLNIHVLLSSFSLLIGVGLRASCLRKPGE